MPFVDGIASGFDTTALIEGILAVQRGPVDALKLNVADLEDRKEKVTDMMSRLEDLATAAKALDELSEFQGAVSTSSDESVVTAELTAEAIPGSYEIEVTSLATTETEASQGFADPEASTITHGTLSVDVAGVSTDIVIDETNDSLAGVASALDEVDGITSYVVHTREATDPYKLVVQTEVAGEAQTVSFDESGIGDALGMTQTAAAADTVVTVNGLEVRSTALTIDAFPGMRLEIGSMNVGEPATVTVGLDAEVTTDLVQGFVDAYNEVINYHSTNSMFDPALGIKGALSGDATTRRVVERMGSIVSGDYAVDGALDALSQIGISTETNGSLKLDTGELKSALEADFEGVAALFTDTGGPVHALVTEIEDVFVDPTSGTMQSRIDSIEETIADTESRIEFQEEMLDQQAGRLRTRFTAMELALAEMQNTSAFLSSLLPSTGILP